MNKKIKFKKTQIEILHKYINSNIKTKTKNGEGKELTSRVKLGIDNLSPSYFTLIKQEPPPFV
jgi:hypothetical protein